MKHAYNIKARLAHLPIEPCSPHPDNGILLSLEGNVFLHRNSYIKTENWHTLSSFILRSYDRSGKSFVLTNDSYQELINYVNFIPVTSPTMNPLPGDSRYAQYSRPDPWPNLGSGGNNGRQISPRTVVFILVLCAAIFGAACYGVYWVAMQAIEVAKGVAKSVWD